MIGEELYTKLEKDNEHDEYAVVVILDGHLPCTISLVSSTSMALSFVLTYSVRQVLTSCYYMCGHVKYLPHLPYGCPACIRD